MNNKIILLTVVICLCSCGPTNKVPISHDKVSQVSNDSQSGSSKTIDYSHCSYIELSELLNEAINKNDSEKQAMFSGLIDQFKERTYREVSYMSLPEAANYYRNNLAELPFLGEHLSAEIMEGLDEQPYEYVKQVHGMFQETPLGDEIEGILIPMREEILSEMTSELNAYFLLENELVSDLKTLSNWMAVTKAGEGITKVNDELLEEYYSGFLSKVEEHLAKLYPKPQQSNKDTRFSKMLKKRDGRQGQSNEMGV